MISEDKIVICWFQIVGGVTEKAHLPIFRLVLGAKSCLETDVLECGHLNPQF